MYNMLKKQFIYLLLASIILPLLSKSQTRQLSLKEALDLAEVNNYNNQSSEARIEAAKAIYRMTNSVFLPSLNINNTGVSTNDPLNAFGFKLKQEIVTVQDFNPDVLNDPDAISNFNTSAVLKQPILNMDGIYARRAAKNKYEASVFENTRIKHNIKFQVKNAYYLLNLVESAIGVLQQSVEVAEESLRLTKDNEKQGFAKYADVLDASVRVADRKNQLADAQKRYQDAHDYLLHLLGLEETSIETVDTLIHPPTQALINTNAINIESRSDFKAIQKQIEAGQNWVRSTKMKFVPRVNAFGSAELNDSKYFGKSASSYSVGASLSWSLFNGYKDVGAIQHSNARLEEARINYQDYLSQNKIQVNKALRKIEVEYQAIALSKLAKEQAQEALRIRTNRYKQGLEKTADLLMAETLSSQKELEYIQSIYNYKQSVFEMELLLEQEINE